MSLPRPGGQLVEVERDRRAGRGDPQDQWLWVGIDVLGKMVESEPRERLVAGSVTGSRLISLIGG